MALLTNTWNGRIRHAPLLNIAILLASGVTFGLAVSYANASIRTPVDEYALISKTPHPANSKIIVYSTFMPFFTILQSGLDLVLYFLVSIHPLYSLVISTLYFVGWLTQWTLWMDCEISGIGFDNHEMCWQNDLDHRKYSQVPILSSEAIVDGRVGLGAVVIALYGAYFIMALMTVLRNRRHGGHSVKIGSAEELR
ncbi:MAG: hypothetical protein Q9178_007321 [Gyalolechia marmorata]